MNVGVATLAVIALFTAAWLWKHKIAPKFTTLLALLAGVLFGGALGGLLGRVINTLLGTVGTFTGRLIGVGAAAVLAGLAFVATLEVVFKGMWPKKAKPKRWHPILALILPTLVIAGGIPLLTQLMTVLSSGASELGRAVTGG